MEIRHKQKNNKMITKQFIASLNGSITDEGLSLINEFFITFSRFECALKASGFYNVNNGKVTANWDTFIRSIRDTFDKERTNEIKNAVDYLIQHPPRIQSIENDRLVWNDRNFNQNEPLENKLCLSIRDIRNNLFHGGKFQGNYQEDVSRNYKLLNSSIIILNEWLRLDESVKVNFLKPIQ